MEEDNLTPEIIGAESESETEPRNVCDNTKPMADWLNEPEVDGECRPCVVANLFPEYQEALKEGGYDGIANELTQALEGEGDIVLDVAKVMDKAKGYVGEDTKERLKGLDCMAQNFDFKQEGEEVE